jgi:hypothetical protein
MNKTVNDIVREVVEGEGERVNYQDLMGNAVIEWCEELDKHNGRWTKRAHELAALSNKYCALWRVEREGER